MDLDAWWGRFIGARHDTADGTRKNYRKAANRFSALLGSRNPHTLSVADIQEAVGALVGTLGPRTLAKYVNTLRQVLDFAEVDPNVARDRRVKLPRIVRDEPEPPDAQHVLAMLDKLTPRWLLAFVTAEQTGMRVGEIASVCWRDVDVAGSQFRMRARETKSRRAKWVPVPEWLMDEIGASCALEDRLPDRRVFLRVDEDGLRNAMLRACRTAQIPVFSPHDLRHRRITIWHHGGMPTKEIQQRVGHARKSETLDVYAHVMPLAEVAETEFLAALRRRREVPVRSRA
jgi:integrase